MPKKRPYKKRIPFRPKRVSPDKRNFQDPIYKNWKKQVKERDLFRCRWPGCLSHKRLEVHHIKKWSSHPEQRYHLSNGITLCNRCHKMIQNKEEHYEEFFMKILEWDFIDKIKNMNKKDI
jgi:5-methylcytosine-specific restriction endonuclease McrA